MQTRSISSEICPKNNHKIRRFLLIAFQPRFAPKIPAKLTDFFRDFVPKNPAKFDFCRIFFIEQKQVSLQEKWRV